ncbi:MAG: 3-dehydroquinate synthase [Deltaproteobacteria bacterium]|nr:3-dehydroquinate synthase [Deltaproteobacteria bacterium]
MSTSATSRHVFLSGPMGAGKSTVGPRLAALLGRSFVDLDAAIATETGLHVAEIFRSKGEATFRRLEADVARRLIGHDVPSVFALGGGTVEDADTRARLLDRGVLITLSAPLDTLLDRAARDPSSPVSRPLLGAHPGDPQAREALARILERRAPAYAEAHRVIDTASATPDEIARTIASSLDHDARSVVVRLGARSHRVVIADGAASSLANELEVLDASSVVVVTDANVRELAERWAAPIQRSVTWVELPAGEAAKTIHSIERIWDVALAARIDRGAVVVAIGGGVVGDMAGFAAATLLRGLRVVQVPTTLLAMVDSSVGGKTGIDRAQGKNLVGAFHQPSLVLCDVSALETLPVRELRAGWAEVVKTAWIEGEGDVAALEAAVETLRANAPEGRGAIEAAIRRAVRTKARIVAMDENERGPRRWLNLGHTYGHAIEAASGYALVHGEAIAVGLVAAMRLSERSGRASAADVARMRSLLGSFGLDVRWPAGLDRAALASFLSVDKKSEQGQLRFVTAGSPGQVGTLAIEGDRVLAFVDELSSA